MNGIVDVFELLAASWVIVSKNKVSQLECIKLNSIALLFKYLSSTSFLPFMLHIYLVHLNCSLETVV